MGNILDKFKDRQRTLQQRKNVKMAGKLAGLREERIRREGIVKVQKAYSDEKARIKMAKTTQFNNSFVGKLAKGVAKNVEKSRKAQRKNPGGGFTL